MPKRASRSIWAAVEMWVEIKGSIAIAQLAPAGPLTGHHHYSGCCFLVILGVYPSTLSSEDSTS